MATLYLEWGRCSLVTSRTTSEDTQSCVMDTRILCAWCPGPGGEELASWQTGVKCHMSLGNQGPGGEMSTQLSQVNTSLGWQTYYVVSTGLFCGCLKTISNSTFFNIIPHTNMRHLIEMTVPPLRLCMWSATWPAPLSDVRCSVSVPDVSNLCLAGQRTPNGK